MRKNIPKGEWFVNETDGEIEPQMALRKKENLTANASIPKGSLWEAQWEE